jgi:hypothetical protein
MDDLASKKIKRLATLQGLRAKHVDVWRSCYEYTYPLRANGFYGDDISAQNALDQRAKLTDSTTTDAVRTLASQIMEGMTPANALWFLLDVGKESDDEKRWLYDAAKLIWENIHNSNFDSAGFESIVDAVCAGWFVMYIDEADEGGYSFEQWPISEVCASASKAGGPVDTVYRSYKLTADQAFSEFGDKVSEDIRKAIADNKSDTKFEFLHCIEPRQKYAVNARLAKNMPIASYHIECTRKRLVREGGYHEMPCVVPRWMLIPGTAYAVGPVFDALPDTKMINELRRMMLANVDLAIAGMWIAEDDGVLNPRTVKVGARKVIVANSVESMRELKSGSDFNVGFVEEERIQRQIRKILLADQLQPNDGPAMTATEVHVRVQLIRQLLGPIYGRLQSEYLQPMIERCFGIAYRAGVLGRAPDSLAEREFSVKYISPLARAQKLEEVTAIDQYVAGLLSVAEFDPDVMDNVDLDAAARIKGEALGVPTEVIPTKEMILERRQQRQQQQQEQQEQMQSMELEQEAGKAAIKKVVGSG